MDQVVSIAAELPNSTAIKQDDGKQVSYAEMMDRANQVCRGLRARNIKPGSRVAVLLPPNIDSICVLLAILQQGLVWVPLDPRNHRARLAAIIADSKPCHVLCCEATKHLAQDLLVSGFGEMHKPELLLGLQDLLVPASSSVSDLMANVSSRDADAVILYTSGSTGVPKGVRLTHLGLLNQIYVLAVADVVGQREVVLQQTSHGFDMALDQIFNALARGGTLIMVGQQGRGDPRHVSKLMLSEGVTYTCIVPSEYHMMLQYGFDYLKQCRQWRFAHAGGEKVTHHLRRAFRDPSLPDLKLFNAYGPTETYLGCPS